ncbi:nucleotide sugar dehydrogenase [Solimonas soli]|uniref:nucleotide sugar dehydrogenase n=1 Tax=Solimonas soli TaxID=413479 RepID=UPI0004808FC9
MSQEADLAALRIGVVGLGYVGLPLAVAFGQRYPSVGFDIKAQRIAELRAGHDRTGELDADRLHAAQQLHFSDDPQALNDCNFYIVTVPTPVDSALRPDLAPLEGASRLLGQRLKRGDTVVYESTVYPGTTEEVCVPILERESGLVFNRDFFCGYSPERINPGDAQRGVADIVKVTSGSTPECAAFVDTVYRSIIKAGTHRASSIKVAEAAKVIENAQRDVNIALMNELAMIFNKMEIDTGEVLRAAGTKWNFLPFRPGLVGGHCIGVDPYYLTHKATVLGYHPELLLVARRINDKMGIYVANQVMRLMAARKIHIVGSRILVLGLTFKENCRDLRNTKVIDIVNELKRLHAEVDVHDPWADPQEAKAEFGIHVLGEPAPATYDAIVLAVAHSAFAEMGTTRLHELGRAEHVVFDVKGVLPQGFADARL